MSKFKYNETEKQINSVLKHQDEALKSIQFPSSVEVDAIASKADALLRNLGYQPVALKGLASAQSRKVMVVPAWDECCAEAERHVGMGCELEPFFTEEELRNNELAIRQLNEEFNAVHRLDAVDVSIAALAGLVGATVDILLVGIPQKTPEGLKGAPLSNYVRGYFDKKFPEEEMQKLVNSKVSKVPYDAQDNRHTTIRVEGLLVSLAKGKWREADMQENHQKIKLLKLMELLKQETDEFHPLSTSEICKRLGAMNISCERRTLAKDIALLNEQGFEVMWCKVGKEKGYYIEDRSFSVPELKILIDAVQAANFITDKKSIKLIDKISTLGGSHRADILKNNLVCFNTCKHSNEMIYYSVGYLEEAIQQQNKVLFRYFDLDEHGEKVYRCDGHRYVVEPVALVFYEDNYYIVVYSAKHDSTANYRVDRMDSVEILCESVSQKALTLRNEVAGYTERVFKMYGGQPVDIVIEFDDRLIGVVYDKFGENTKMIRTHVYRCVATVKVQISPTFWGWMFQFGKQMRILSPANLIEERKNKIRELIEDTFEEETK